MIQSEEDTLVDQEPSQGNKKSCKVNGEKESSGYSEVLYLPAQEVHQQEKEGKYLRYGKEDKENSDFTKYYPTQTEEEQYKYQEDGQTISSTSYLALHCPTYTQETPSVFINSLETQMQLVTEASCSDLLQGQPMKMDTVPPEGREDLSGLSMEQLLGFSEEDPTRSCCHGSQGCGWKPVKHLLHVVELKHLRAWGPLRRWLCISRRTSGSCWIPARELYTERSCWRILGMWLLWGSQGCGWKPLKHLLCVVELQHLRAWCPLRRWLCISRRTSGSC
ncbi:hypothetical protein E2320_014345 [Naja naja]|nr:hypothetical protein E2320_014345 [Naja naja]